MTHNAWDPSWSLTSASPADTVLSPDGSRLYVTGNDGNLTVYDTTSGTLLATWDVGADLGAMDISQDGSFLIVIDELVTILNGSSTAKIYKVNTINGSVTTYSFVTQNGYPFFDVAVLSNGKALLTQDAYSGFLPLWTLDPSNGSITGSAENYSERGTLTRSNDGTTVIFTPANNSSSPIYMYKVGNGIVDSHINIISQGYSVGVDAFSKDGGIIAEFVYGFGIAIYDQGLNFQKKISFLDYPEIENSISGMTFDDNGENLYVLSGATNKIVQFSTDNWEIVHIYDVGGDVVNAPTGAYGNRLLLGPDDTFIVTTIDGVRVVTQNSIVTDFIGSNQTDVIVGDGNGNTIIGNSGSDRLYGAGGNDTLDGGLGDDSLNGGSGADVLNGGVGDDTVFLTGARSNYSLTIASGGDLVLTDVRLGSPDGADVIYLIENFYFSDGYASLDSFGPFIINGSNGPDFLYGTYGDDIVSAGAGDDYLDNSFGNDRLDGGLGTDQVLLNFTTKTAGVAFTFTGNQTIGTSYGEETLISIERASIYGSPFNDIITGGGGDDLISGAWGSDVLNGGGGNDILLTDGGDTLNGGEGVDTVLFSLITLPAGISYVFSGNASIAIQGWTANFSNIEAVSVTGTNLDDVMTGGAFDDGISAAKGNDKLYGAGGNDRLVATEPGFSATLTGGSGNDYLTGNGTTTIAAFSGNRSDYQVAPDGVTGRTIVTDLRVGSPDGIDTLDAVKVLAFADGIYSSQGTGSSLQQRQANSYQLSPGAYNLFGTGTGQGLRGNGLDNHITAGSGDDYVNASDGGADDVTSGDGRDVIYYGAALTSADSNDAGDEGGDARGDVLVIQGNYDITLGADALVDVEKFRIQKGEFTGWGDTAGNLYSYDITTVDANVAAGLRVVVQGGSLQLGEHLRFDGAAETDGSFQMFGGHDSDELIGGAQGDHLLGRSGDDILTGNGGDDRLRGGLGADTMNGGAGADIFVYAAQAGAEPYANAVLESTGLNYDTIIGFNFAEDKIDLPGAVSSFDKDVTGALNTATFDADLASAVNGSLAANGAVLFNVTSGDHATETFLVVDADGNGSYQADLDFVIELEDFLGTPPASPDFFM